MSAWDHVPAHLVPCGPAAPRRHEPAAEPLTFGTPPSPTTELRPPPRAMIRQAGVHGTELHARDGATTIILPLDEDQLLGLVDEAMSGLFRARAGRRNQRRLTHG